MCRELTTAEMEFRENESTFFKLSNKLLTATLKQLYKGFEGEFLVADTVAQFTVSVDSYKIAQAALRNTIKDSEQDEYRERSICLIAGDPKHELCERVLIMRSNLHDALTTSNINTLRNNIEEALDPMKLEVY